MVDFVAIKLRKVIPVQLTIVVLGEECTTSAWLFDRCVQ